MALPVRDLRMMPALPTGPVAASDPFPPLRGRSRRLIVLRGALGSIAAITVDLATPGTVAPAFFAAAAWTDVAGEVRRPLSADADAQSSRTHGRRVAMIEARAGMTAG